jgi:hypothetical protein
VKLCTCGLIVVKFIDLSILSSNDDCGDICIMSVMFIVIYV